MTQIILKIVLFVCIIFSCFILSCRNYSNPIDPANMADSATVTWTYKTLDSINSSPAIGNNGVIYIGSDDSWLYAIEPTGVLAWKFQTYGKVQSSPLVDMKGNIYFGSNDGYIYSIDQNGSLNWKYNTDEKANTSPAQASDGTIYYAATNNKLYAFLPSGDIKWTYIPDEGTIITSTILYASPSVAEDGTIYFNGRNYHLYAINPDGTLKWKFDLGDWVKGSTIIGNDGTIYVEVGYLIQYLLAVNPDGTEKWRYPSISNEDIYVYSCVIGNDGNIYASSYYHDQYVPMICLSPQGDLLKEFTLGPDESRPLIGKNGNVIYTSNKCGSITSDDQVNWDLEISSTGSTLTLSDDGVLYLGNRDGFLYAIKTRELPSSESSWPQFRQNVRQTARVGTTESYY